jgi:hypothetical protein
VLADLSHRADTSLHGQRVGKAGQQEKAPHESDNSGVRVGEQHRDHHETQGNQEARHEVREGRPECRSFVQFLRFLVHVDAQRIADIVGDREDEQAAHDGRRSRRRSPQPDDDSHAGNDGRGAAEAEYARIEHRRSELLLWLGCEVKAIANSCLVRDAVAG